MRLFSWALLTGGLIWFLGFVFCILAARDAAGTREWPGLNSNTYYAITSFISDFALPGLIALCLSQLLRFILEHEYRGGWILRYGHGILYGCGALIVCNVVLKMVLLSKALNPVNLGLVFVSPLLVPMLAKVLIVVGLGVILKRVVPIIDESRTLV